MNQVSAMGMVIPTVCSICGQENCEHIAEQQYRNATRSLAHSYYPLYTFADIKTLLMINNIEKYAIHTYVPGTVKIFIYDYWVNTKKIEKTIEERKMMTIRYIVKKSSFIEYVNTLKVLRYIRYKYIKFKRGKIVAKNKFDFIMN